MSKRTFALIFTLFTVAVVLVIIALYNPSSYETKIVVVPTPTKTPMPLAQTELRFGKLSTAYPIELESKKPPVYSLPILISTGTNKVTAVQLELSYDPQMMTAISLAPSNFFPKPVSLLNQIDEKNGRISYAIGTSPNESGIQGEAVVAILTFQTRSLLPGQTNISFLPKTQVAAEGINPSVLKEAFSAQIVIGESVATIGGQTKNIDK